MMLHDDSHDITPPGDAADAAGAASDRARAGRSRRRLGVAAGGLVAAGVVATLAAVTVSGGSGAARMPTAGASRADARAGAQFAALREARSNRCALQAADLAGMPAGASLQGSCCSAMDLETYLRQRRGLAAYAGVPEVPADPYDIPVGLARRLLSYRDVRLSPAQQDTYDAAVRTSRNKGPCCCQCWRWDAFAGQAKALISQRGYGAAEVARVWDLEDGCGGSRPTAGT